MFTKLICWQIAIYETYCLLKGVLKCGRKIKKTKFYNRLKTNKQA